MSVEESLKRWAPKLRLVSILAALVAFLIIARALPLKALSESFGTWVESLGVWGPVIYGAVYVLATVLMIPASVLTLAAGAVFGLGLGTVVVSLASTTGAACAFLLGRYLLRDKVARTIEARPKLKAVDDAIAEGGYKIVALLRLSPAVPFNLQNYLYGLTPVGFWPCVLASWLAMLPGTFLYVYLGYTAGQVVAGDAGGSIGKKVALGVGLLATVVVTVYVTKLAKRKLDERTRVEASAGAVAQAAEPEASSPQGWPVGALVTAGIAAVLVATAAYVNLHPEAVEALFAGVLPAAAGG